jgi:hypothetical protein
MEVKPGYYTIRDNERGGVTVCRVDEDDWFDEVPIMNYTPGYTKEDVFGPNSEFTVLAGPWEPPQQ